ncbi:defective in cullin neddylation protein 1 [Yarrowia lipolytica]|jgi:DCN1-like protein 1/2|uniref:Defective in cullin neddylation protein 1 n=2 Tax=Yarrowia lipolytica TaxID=4952 RepID=DCN1_YARLI|nr:YALI0F26147p [Yarrowia lipolytica CLIB122]Q6C0B6.1 RecName: Full=Defective in cullin neddylation protein 1 [Yarrowia lipolytica CLIB122]AOW07726.1 hypothetical protein YALI1_F33594g [Yarrowia lipolytica]KAB8284528.1 defective in cullin neddylation protein 1 [Yarrowia lipolytica]KAE8174431.1 defective in cullin neddylation protein 1 [Yarrowia lipolytica]KAJ8055220.1 defective in cullin neddylation protein 1 [Yarrowia lipolytica]QNP99429.1 Defective in cullin neddylation protein 1 [Yarrowia |eukprot:XP_505896.1 YALI0F26147p [Yarrowia lipolytica CLIB122]
MVRSDWRAQEIRRVMTFTGSKEKTARDALEKFDWNVEVAIDHILNTPQVDLSGASKVFDKYRNADSDEIDLDGTIQYITDLGLSLEEPTVLAVAMTAGSPSVGTFTRKPFVEGWAAIGGDTLPAQQKLCRSFAESMTSLNADFQKIYKFTYGFLLQEGQRVLPQETAVDYWRLLLTGKYEHLDKWLSFVTEKYKRNISRDAWNMLYEFMLFQAKDPSLESYDEDGAWPSVIDEYVEFLKE